MLQPYVTFCHSKYQTYWLVVMYVYKGILLFFGTFLAWETRKVKIPALNDSKLIGISVYNVFILCAIGVGVSYALRSEPAALFIFLSFVVLFCNTITLGVVFIPKIITVYKDPLGVNATGKKNRTSGLESMDMKSSTAIDYAPELSVISTGAPDKDNQKLQDKVDMLKKQLQGTKDLNAILKDTDDNMCGVWCCGLSCGCSYIHGCFYSDEDDECTPGYTIKQEESTSGDVFMGDEKPSGHTKPATTADRGKNGQAAGTVESIAVDVEVGVENAGYVATSYDEHDTKATPSPAVESQGFPGTVYGAEASPDLSAWRSSSNSTGVPCAEHSMEASKVRVVTDDNTPRDVDEDEC
ncbi:gamma-aminobutyric acid type B receptor subunit 2 [Strongylocentrotus purpuratus]|uniref:G-protein coupled receptors family 3 profile domain-containing protein n=1 Tax=Strongylocentrotus purpuratus TaxID=7668 RepID=A0A7M7HM01_STRPU|nr:gamma-aminobutyric acid type B receptor subunit 2 [Strongylocentrotus purpuratus]|eukprot:XP_011672354.1 PREDICTED: gamma-aminobutyric acid type B receptor subunit 2 [Strongylocentrotus purpuratus]